jgi:dienelactone hydrolase
VIRAVLSTFLVVATVADARAVEPAPLAYDAASLGPPGSGAPLELWRPSGAGPFATVIVLHGCQGVGEGSRSWASRLAGWGYVAAIVDSFRPRNIQEVCGQGWLVPSDLRAQDAFNAARYLRGLTEGLDGQVGLIGFSHGGSSVVIAAEADPARNARGDGPFQAAVAYYPACPSRVGPFATDLLILIGKDDHVVSAERCATFVEANAGVAHAPEIEVYAGAAHGFDVPGLDRLSPTGQVMRNHPAAAAEAYARTRAFLDARLKAR